MQMMAPEIVPVPEPVWLTVTVFALPVMVVAAVPAIVIPVVALDNAPVVSDWLNVILLLEQLLLAEA